MNIVFTAQTSGIKIFYHLLDKIKGDLDVGKTGCLVSHSMFYRRFLKKHPEFETDHVVVKEWELVELARKVRPDLEKIRDYEEAVGNPTLWEPLICDRRIYLGKQASVKQDYCPSFTHEQMLSVLQVAMEELERLLDRLEPEIVLSLDPVTFGDYILFLLAQTRDIPMLFFRTSKIENYLTLHEGVFGCSPHIYDLFQEYEENGSCDQWIAEAREYLERSRGENIRYEGMILAPSERKKRGLKKKPVSLLRGLRTEIEYLLQCRNDIDIPGIWKPYIYREFVAPFKARLFNWKYSRHYILASQLDSFGFAFFPLQSEPEISSLIWGKSYMNQIETIRNIARSLPVGMKLLVKEHPRALGYRSSGYYKKILEIPNVLMVDPDLEVQLIIKDSEIVITIATFVSLEAIIHKKPTIMLGGPRPFAILPDSMIRFVNSTNDLAAEIADLMRNYEYKENPLIHYIAATMRGSVAVDYFTTLLRKKGRYGDSGQDEYDEEIAKMAVYTTHRIKEVLCESSTKDPCPK
jgi:hypothetical protein